MNQAEVFYSVIQVVVVLIPIMTLAWKLGKQAEKMNEIEVKQKKLEEKTEALDINTDVKLDTIVSALNDIKINIAKLQTRFDNLEENQRK